MSWSTNVDLVQKLYIAFYGRPADPGGLRYWASQLPDNATPDSQAVKDLINSFVNSAEAQSRFGSPDLNAAIDRIYNFAFHRNATTDEKNAFAGKTVADVLVSVLSVSSGPDYASLNNKLQYANWFWEYIDPNKDGIPDDDSTTGTKFMATYAGNTDASDIASKLNFIDSSNPPLQANVLNDVKSIADTGDAIFNQNQGKTIALTPAIDNLTGTAYDDVFIGDRAAGGPNQTVQAGDHLDGGGGNDILRLYGFTATAGIIPSITHIETVEFVGGAPTNLNIQPYTDVQTLRFKDITVLNNSVNANILSSQTVELNNVGIGAAACTLTLNVSGGKVANVVVNNVHERVAANAVTNLFINDAGALTTLNITATGANSDLSVFGLAAGDHLNIKGDKDIVVTFAAAPDGVFIDASGNSANVTLRLDNTGYAPASDGRLTGVDKIVMVSTTAKTLNLANQTENFDITGSGANDTIILGTGVNTVNAGKGADIINSPGRGNTLTGGLGNDNFVFKFTSFGGADTITDFSTGNDKILLDLNNAFVGLTRVTGGAKVRVVNNAGATTRLNINTTSGTMAVKLTSMQLFTGSNVAKLKTAVTMAANGASNNDFAIAFGRTTVNNKLYIVFLNDANTGTSMGAMFSKIITVANVPNGFGAGDIYIF